MAAMLACPWVVDHKAISSRNAAWAAQPFSISIRTSLRLRLSRRTDGRRSIRSVARLTNESVGKNAIRKHGCSTKQQ
jgi:hypothetical protein